MKAFDLQTRDLEGRVLRTVAAYPVIVIADTRVFRFGVHRDPLGGWLVSDPESGCLIGQVHTYYKGARCSSQGLGARAAVKAAHMTITERLENIGANRFIEVVEGGREYMKGKLRLPKLEVAKS